ncbi:MAG: type II toxin-antitoxin system VapC family toxin [Proteobacteria bacterium]|nr:type II toxin-antitoxin system VapC family toxin [Pseudomonadota bacterium]
MSLIVVDASVAAAWLLPNQATDMADALFAEWEAHSGIAPGIFAIETRALLLKAERRLWIREKQLTDARARLQRFNITLWPTPEADALEDLVELARSAEVSLYDALYLGLALETGAELATRDGRLIGAATRLGVTVRDLRSATGLHED